MSLPKVTMIATAEREDCGIETYTSSLQSSMDVDIERFGVPLRSRNPLDYIRRGIAIFRDDSDTIHLQHEYGIYGPKSVWSWPFLLAIWAKRKIDDVTVITTFHSAWSDDTVDPPLENLKRIYVTANNRLLAAITDEGLFLSEETLEEFRKTADVNARVIPHGVQTDVRHTDEAEAKRHFGVDPDETLVVGPGYVRPQKGFEDVVEMARESNKYTFMIGGGAQDDSHRSYADGIRRRIPDGMQMTGVLDEDDFHRLFSAMDVAVLPYNVVTQSGIINWCVAYDVPVVTSDLDRFKQLESEYGFPLTYPKGDIQAGLTTVGEALERDFTDEIERYRSEHSMSRVAEVHKDLYS
ncbi:glycosyltransferase [Halorhabdus amylolytica]|uniref:glycosyltransferase n=1 Tax=Halorhabdus amylolytica TaxID=2559573 RepID=UPI0010AB1756|nr:glycosyltransferase [Halorhabdus amylolytica]